MMTMMMMTNMSENVTFKKKQEKSSSTETNWKRLFEWEEKKRIFSLNVYYLFIHIHIKIKPNPNPKTIGDDHRHFFRAFGIEFLSSF